MSDPVTNIQIEDCLREILKHKRYALSPKRVHGETGVDIVAKKRRGRLLHRGYRPKALVMLLNFLCERLSAL